MIRRARQKDIAKARTIEKARSKVKFDLAN
jgi:hypothetical protein